MVGEKDAQIQTVTLRDGLVCDLGSMSLDAVVGKLREEVDAKTVRQIAVQETPPATKEEGGEY